MAVGKRSASGRRRQVGELWARHAPRRGPFTGPNWWSPLWPFWPPYLSALIAPLPLALSNTAAGAGYSISWPCAFQRLASCRKALVQSRRPQFTGKVEQGVSPPLHFLRTLLLLAFQLGSTGLKAAFPPVTLRMRKETDLPRFDRKNKIYKQI